ncbi:MAG: YifB family Mg chelatase-like AAA ATPase [Coriobacteriia bacterium]
MRAVLRTATILGVDAVPVDVEADVASGLPGFTIVGLPDAAVQEARDRVRSAIRASSFDFPQARVLVNLAPAPIPKRGTGFDLPIALAVLAATGQVAESSLRDCLVVGELSLDGSVRPVSGLLAHVIAASRQGMRVIGPPEGSAYCAALPGLAYDAVERLADFAADGASPPTDEPSPRDTGSSADPAPPPTYRARPLARDGVSASRDAPPDLEEVVGNPVARRALEIAAAGGHNLMLEGPPGTGKTLLARCMPGLLPPMSETERLETALIHSVSGIDETAALRGVRPFRSPHHSASTAGLVGGGRPPRPGEVSLAHNGVLFLDEMNEFAPSVLQTLRQPLEEGRLTLVRAEGAVTFPASFTLIGAINPCPCGYAGDPRRRCTCAPGAVERHRARIGGPLLDRIDLYVRVEVTDPAMLVEARREEPTAKVASRVLAARRFAEESHPPVRTLSGDALITACRLDTDARTALQEGARVRSLSGRGVTRILRVSRTIADLEGSGEVRRAHVMEAFSYRGWRT